MVRALKMEDSVGQKWKQPEFALVSVADVSSGFSSASRGIARFTCDGLQIHQESHQVPLNVDLRTAQVRLQLLLLCLVIAIKVKM